MPMNANPASAARVYAQKFASRVSRRAATVLRSNFHRARSDTDRNPSTLVLLLCTTLLLACLTGCATRFSRHQIIDRRFTEVDLVTQVEGLFQTVAQGYEHPAIISQPRLINILNAVEVETPHEGGGFVREPALYPELVEPAATALAEALAQAGPDQAIAVKLIRKEAKIGVFHNKYLTSFLAYMKDDQLYIVLSRVNWLIPQSKETKKLPEPRPDQSPMNFRVVSGEHLFYAGPQALEIAWRDPVFRTPYHLPGTAGGEKRRREVLFQSPIPKDELREASESATSIDELSAEQLRALADLEEDRSQGRITEAGYQRAKRHILRDR
jgi:hypothetical protein